MIRGHFFLQKKPIFKGFHFQFKPVWSTHVPTGHSTVLMKKGSQFTRFFSQEMRKLETTGNLDLLKKRYLRSPACKPPLKEKPLGYEKLSFLFVMLIFGCIMSILVVLFEYMTQSKNKEQEITRKGKEVEEIIGEILEVQELPNQETKNVLGRLLQKCIEKETKHC